MFFIVIINHSHNSLHLWFFCKLFYKDKALSVQEQWDGELIEKPWEIR